MAFLSEINGGKQTSAGFLGGVRARTPQESKVAGYQVDAAQAEQERAAAQSPAGLAKATFFGIPKVLQDAGKAVVDEPTRILATPVIRTEQAIAALAGKATGNKALESAAYKPMPVPSLFGGTTAEPIAPQRALGEGGARQIAGNALEYAGTVYPGSAAEGVVGRAVEGRVAKAAVEGATGGAIGGALYGSGSAVKDPNASAADVAKSTGLGTAAGLFLGGALGAGGARLAREGTIPARQPLPVQDQNPAVFQHGTSPEAAASIAKNGFISEPGGNGALLGKGVYLDKTGGAGASAYGPSILDVEVKPGLNLWKGDIMELYGPETGYGDPEKVAELLKSRGYDGVDGKNQVVIFDPANVSPKPGVNVRRFKEVPVQNLNPATATEPWKSLTYEDRRALSTPESAAKDSADPFRYAKHDGGVLSDVFGPENVDLFGSSVDGVRREKLNPEGKPAANSTADVDAWIRQPEFVSAIRDAAKKGKIEMGSFYFKTPQKYAATLRRLADSSLFVDDGNGGAYHYRRSTNEWGHQSASEMPRTFSILGKGVPYRDTFLGRQTLRSAETHIEPNRAYTPPDQLPVIKAGPGRAVSTPTKKAAVESRVVPLEGPKTPVAGSSAAKAGVSTPKALKVKKTGPVTVAKGAGEANARLAAAGVDRVPAEDLAAINSTSKKDQARVIAGILDDNTQEDVVAMALGQKRIPKEAAPQALYETVKAKAVLEKDYELQRRLASSPLLSQRAYLAQQLGAAGYFKEPVDAVAAMSEVARARADVAEKRGLDKGFDEKVAKARESIRRANAKETWDSVVDSITC